MRACVLLPPQRTPVLQLSRIEHEVWERMLDMYYSLHGWDAESGRQTMDSLEAVDLKAVADRLEEAGKLRLASMTPSNY
ncbi:hypothetical protein ISS40_02785 [Candidatus Bathyarchaeota archaeon]|nr:hypothetical protein [Candidatus Bathyarchaeota archaeon]MBL7167576.1 hypothetical protein [Candidatus Bathyarchaeota archaeon]